MQELTQKKTEYRNATRSKKLIKDAFMQLSRKKDISHIKVKDILEIADVSKGTFYAHYSCVYDVLQEIEDYYIYLMFNVFETHNPREILDDFTGLFTSIVEVMDKERIFFLMLFKSSFGDGFSKVVRSTFIEYMTSDPNVINEFKSKDLATAYFVYVAGGSFVLLRRWLEKTIDIEPLDAVSYMNEFIIQGMKSIRK